MCTAAPPDNTEVGPSQRGLERPRALGLQTKRWLFQLPVEHQRLLLRDANGREVNTSQLGPFSVGEASRSAGGRHHWRRSAAGIHRNARLPAGGQGAVDGGPLGLGDGVEGVAVAVADQHLDRQQRVVCRAVTCETRPSSAPTNKTGSILDGGTSCLTLPGLFAAVGGVAVAVRVPGGVGAGGVAFWEHPLPALGQLHTFLNLQLSFRGSGGGEVHCGEKTFRSGEGSFAPPQKTRPIVSRRSALK